MERNILDSNIIIESINLNTIGCAIIASSAQMKLKNNNGDKANLQGVLTDEMKIKQLFLKDKGYQLGFGLILSKDSPINIEKNQLIKDYIAPFFNKEDYNSSVFYFTGHGLDDGSILIETYSSNFTLNYFDMEKPHFKV